MDVQDERDGVVPVEVVDLVVRVHGGVQRVYIRRMSTSNAVAVVLLSYLRSRRARRPCTTAAGLGGF